MVNREYSDLLISKQKSHINSGFNVDISELNTALFPFQKFCVQRALRCGKYAFFQDCGLGKTIQQLEWARLVNLNINKPILILAPLAVTGQTIDEGNKFNIKVVEASFNINHPHYAPIQIANYEQLENIDCSIFGGVVLDESSILKNFEGATKNLIIDLFKNTPYKLCCTATPSPNDPMELGNHSEFLDVMFGFLIKELYRVMISGRNVAVHCMDLPIQKGKEGFIGLRDFSGMILRAFENAGFVYASRVTIWKDPVVEMQRTKALGLLHKQIKKDSTMSRVGIPDYVLIFRKDGERNNPVTNKDLPVDLWQKYASPVWMDIDYGNTLQGYRNGRDDKDEKHICPLQLETIERLIHLYSNKGDTIFTPFMGIGSEVFQAVKMERKGIGFELKESYFDIAKKNLRSAVEMKQQMTLIQ